MTPCRCSSDTTTGQANSSGGSMHGCQVGMNLLELLSSHSPSAAKLIPVWCRAVLRVWLRRQGSSRKLQRMWRGFVKRRQTTHALAVKVAETGITGVKLPQVRLLHQQRAALQRWVHDVHAVRSTKAAPCEAVVSESVAWCVPDT